MFNKSDFLDSVKEGFFDALNTGVELLDKYYDTEENAWDADEIQTDADFDFEEAFDEAVSDVVQRECTYTSDCWEICKEIIGSDDFDEYNELGDIPRNINGMAIACLDQLAKEKLDWEDLLVQWAEDLDPPEDPDKTQVEEIDYANY